MKNNKKGDVKSFESNWKKREESLYNHWTRDKVTNQIQLAFRNHWTLFKEIINNESNFNGGKRTLEIGCGRGTLSSYFSDAGYNCTLVDISETIIQVAKSIFKENNLKGSFLVGDTNELNFPNNSFDIIFSIGLLEHFEDISSPISEQVRVLDEGGIWFGYIVPHYDDNIQKEYDWINNILKGYQSKSDIEINKKESLFRSDSDSKKYVEVLKRNGLRQISVSGVYPIPMISHSIDFPFSLMPQESEIELVKHFEILLEKNQLKNRKHPWMCDEGYGNAFLVWGIK